MSKENKVVALATTVAMTISVLAVLVGSGIGWGMLQSRIISLEARATSLSVEIQAHSNKKLEKEIYYKDQEKLYNDIQEIKKDIKLLLRQTKK